MGRRRCGSVWRRRVAAAGHLPRCGIAKAGPRKGLKLERLNVTGAASQCLARPQHAAPLVSRQRPWHRRYQGVIRDCPVRLRLKDRVHTPN